MIHLTLDLTEKTGQKRDTGASLRHNRTGARHQLRASMSAGWRGSTGHLREWLPDETDVRRDQLLTNTINLEARFKFKTDALHEWLAVETDALYDRMVGEEVITFHEQLKIETDCLHEQVNIDVGRLDEMTQFDVDAHCERLVSRIDALQGLRWGQTGTPV